MLANECLVGLNEGGIVGLPGLALLVHCVEARSIRLCRKLPAGHATCYHPHGLMYSIASLVMLPLTALHDRAADAFFHEFRAVGHGFATVVSLQDKEK